MNLVHMLDRIIKRRVQLERDEQARINAERVARLEQFLAILTADAVKLIEANYDSPEPDEQFTNKGLIIALERTDDNAEYFDALARERQDKKIAHSYGTESWGKFVEGWRKAGVVVHSQLTLDGKLEIVFVPIQR